MVQKESVVCDKSGRSSIVLGVDTKVIASGKCHHPHKRSVNKEYLKDGLPMPKFAWTHCIFCRGENCFFAGECEYKKDEEEGNLYEQTD